MRSCPGRRRRRSPRGRAGRFLLRSRPRGSGLGRHGDGLDPEGVGELLPVDGGGIREGLRRDDAIVELEALDQAERCVRGGRRRTRMRRVGACQRSELRACSSESLRHRPNATTGPGRTAIPIPIELQIARNPRGSGGPELLEQKKAAVRLRRLPERCSTGSMWPRSPSRRSCPVARLHAVISTTHVGAIPSPRSVSATAWRSQRCSSLVARSRPRQSRRAARACPPVRAPPMSPRDGPTDTHSRPHQQTIGRCSRGSR